MSEEIIQMTEEEALETIGEPTESFEAEVEEPKKEYDIEKIQEAYAYIRTLDTAKMSRVEYQKYQWIEEKLCEAGVIGEIAWDVEFAKEKE